MNDSFLEDLELVAVEQKTGSVVNHAEKYITTRQSSLSVPTTLYTEKNDIDALIKRQQQQQQHKTLSDILKPSSGKKLLDDYSSSKDMNSKRKQVDSKDRIQSDIRKSSKDRKNPIKLRISEKKEKSPDDKLKPVENVDKHESLKTNLSPNNGKKRTINSRESSRLSDGSSKENSRPSDLSAEANGSHSDGTKEWRQVSSGNSKKICDIKEDHNESVNMLNAIKDIVSSYTKMESNKIMRMMQDHYINSQANFMKQLMIMTDELRPSYLEKDSTRIESLIQENRRLLDNIAFLKNRVEELQKVVEVTDKIRQENTALKLKIQEFEK